MSSIFETVTNTIIQELETGVKPWSRPWRVMFGSPFPFNYSTQAKYNGINRLLLYLTASSQLYRSNAWVTYKQANKLGGTIKKGSKGVRCIFFCMKEETTDDNKQVKDMSQSNNKENKVIVRSFTLFNLDQTDGILFNFENNTTSSLVNAYNDVEDVIKLSNANIQTGYDKAFYQQGKDVICIPSLNQFDDAGDYYATLMHELVHWTGAKHRLNRLPELAKYGDESYAFEELVAELGSAFICADLSIIGDLQHASYINSWLKILKNDKQAIVRAAAFAQKAYEYIMSSHNSP